MGCVLFLFGEKNYNKGNNMTGYQSKKKAAQGKLAEQQEPPKYSFKAYWTEDGRIGVVACIERPDGGVHLMEAIIDPPQGAPDA